MSIESVTREIPLHVPEFHRIGTDGNQPPAVAGKGYALRLAGMALEDGEFALSGDIPESYGAVAASARQQITLRRKVERPYPFFMTGKDGAEAERREVIKFYRTIRPRDDE